jgi:hypothetical protein
MIRILALLQLLLFCIGLANGQRVNSDSICWQKSYKLKWSDFTGKKPATSLVWHTAGCAASIYAKGCIDKGIPNYRITNYFIKSLSWVTDSLSKGGLEHEQLHFDIAELYARKIRKAIEELRKKKLKRYSNYEQVINRLLDEREAMDVKYDKETFHSMDLDKQKEWSNVIIAALEELKRYASDR